MAIEQATAGRHSEYELGSVIHSELLRAKVVGLASERAVGGAMMVVRRMRLT